MLWHGLPFALGNGYGRRVFYRRQVNGNVVSVARTVCRSRWRDIRGGWWELAREQWLLVLGFSLGLGEVIC
jgi:hypothetical protein